VEFADVVFWEFGKGGCGCKEDEVEEETEEANGTLSVTGGSESSSDEEELSQSIGAAEEVLDFLDGWLSDLAEGLVYGAVREDFWPLELGCFSFCGLWGLSGCLPALF